MLGLFLFLLSCGGKNGGDNGAIARIEITPSQANVSPGQPVPFSAVAKTSSGNSVANVTFTWQSTDPSIATVDADGIATGVTVGVTSIVAVAGTARGSAPLGVVSPARGASNLTLSGTAQYEDKLFNKTGFTDKVPMPIRGAIINLIAIDGFANLDSRTTGEDGTFNFSGIDNSSRRGGLYLQVLSKTDSNHPTQVEIRNNTTDKALYALVSSALDDSAATSFPNRSLLASATSGIGGAFNSLDVFSKANELIRSAGPCSTVSVPPSNSPCLPPLLTAYWEPGSSEGTFYDDQQDAIFILGGGTADGDTDEYDDSVIAHEYGHFIVAHFSHDNSPGGTHTITDNAQDIRLSFSEGWGNFFSSAVRNSPLYVDTFAQGVFSYELEGLTSPQISALSSIAVYDTHELSNSKVLWDIFDAPSGDDDPLQLNFTPIWQTMIQIPAASPATMESFWLTFAALNPSSSNTFASGLQTILQGRKIELFPDANAPSPLTPNAPPPLQHHTLYRNGPDPTGDEDVIPLNNLVQGTPYTVETLNLTNGADTFLFITDASDHPISGLQNDNRNGVNDSTCAAAQGGSSCPPNDKLTLSSSISFNAPSTGTFHAHVKHSPAAPLSAGLFGSYDIQLKSP
jgi:hypothetical protein